ncbi:GAF domain-containing sensor histidine kinase [Fulvivirga lutea]|uniref:histidine kinase n=1 Tax=Fulvivirga lutea TaxID=2810512 RepID=A0A974WK66_9BACT|nr:GAF domain-containing sensor histidine kinase [Fulvivirga lutea]QSE96873.1 GAF domain-containing sensor histidine kinase [Fulvivirga lutea]
MSAPYPENEEQRLKDLQNYNILDAIEEPAFNEIVDLASFICNTPISLVSFVDKERQWFMAEKGLDAKETPREYSFCAHAILDDEIFEIEDAKKDARFENNPLVTGNPNIRFYAGVPLKSRQGHNLGSLCVIDKTPKKLNKEQKKALRILGNRVINELELRKHLKITQEQKNELEKVIHFKDRLLSIISHDLRSPLNSIKSTVSMFEGGMLSNEDIQQLMQYLKIEASTTSQLLDNLLQWAKTKLENFEIIKEPFIVNSIIEETIQLYSPEAKRKGISLSYTNGNNKIELLGDKEMIKLAIRNLINNSIKFCREGDSIKISSMSKGKKGIILLEDTGVGMTAEKVNQILGENKLESVPGTSKEKGIGLGLILINEFIKSNDGKIMGSSQPEVGTTFKVELPLAN